jgi:uncharacterized protein YjbJ (UPF0337 family)
MAKSLMNKVGDTIDDLKDYAFGTAKKAKAKTKNAAASSKKAVKKAVRKTKTKVRAKVRKAKR